MNDSDTDARTRPGGAHPRRARRRLRRHRHQPALRAARRSSARRTACRSTRDNVLGVLSLIFWALMIVVSLKYVVADPARRQPRRGRHPRADRAGARRRRATSRAAPAPLLLLGLFGAALFYGDGVITPAISVLGAVEGLEVGDAGAQALRRADHASAS